MDVHFVLVGAANPEHAQRFRSSLVRRGLAERVHYLGFRRDAYGLIGQSDLLVVPDRNRISVSPGAALRNRGGDECGGQAEIVVDGRRRAHAGWVIRETWPIRFSLSHAPSKDRNWCAARNRLEQTYRPTFARDPGAVRTGDRGFRARRPPGDSESAHVVHAGTRRLRPRRWRTRILASLRSWLRPFATERWGPRCAESSAPRQHRGRGRRGLVSASCRKSRAVLAPTAWSFPFAELYSVLTSRHARLRSESESSRSRPRDDSPA